MSERYLGAKWSQKGRTTLYALTSTRYIAQDPMRPKSKNHPDRPYPASQLPPPVFSPRVLAACAQDGSYRRHSVAHTPRGERRPRGGRWRSVAGRSRRLPRRDSADSAESRAWRTPCSPCACRAGLYGRRAVPYVPWSECVPRGGRRSGAGGRWRRPPDRAFSRATHRVAEKHDKAVSH